MNFLALALLLSALGQDKRTKKQKVIDWIINILIISFITALLGFSIYGVYKFVVDFS